MRESRLSPSFHPERAQIPGLRRSRLNARPAVSVASTVYATQSLQLSVTIRWRPESKNSPPDPPSLTYRASHPNALVNMPADFFLVNFALFAVITGAGTFGQSYFKQQNKHTEAGQEPTAISTQSGSSRSLWRSYIVVYALVMGMPSYAHSGTSIDVRLTFGITYRRRLATRHAESSVSTADRLQALS